MAIALFFLSANPAWSQEGPFVLIGHPGVIIERVSVAELNDLYLGKRPGLTGMPAVAPVHAGPKSEGYKAFVYKVHKMKLADMKRHWAKMILENKIQPPRSFAYYEEILQFVASTPNAIGYVPKSLLGPTVKLIKLDEEESFAFDPAAEAP